MYVIPIGINPDEYPQPSGDRSIDMVGAGSLSPIKQFDQFVDVVQEVVAKMPEVSAAICGNGSEYEALNRQISEAGLLDNIRMLGEIDHTTVLQTMQRSRVLLHPSSYEGFGMVCTEALYAGTHVISFCKPMDASMPHWHVVQDKEEMTKRCLELLQDKNLDHSPILPYKMDDTVIAILRLFDYEEVSGTPC
jgi:glycosyltransferase involved in cell wall biosynthesis